MIWSHFYLAGESVIYFTCMVNHLLPVIIVSIHHYHDDPRHCLLGFAGSTVSVIVVLPGWPNRFKFHNSPLVLTVIPSINT